MTVAGIDPGSRSWSIVVLENNSNSREIRFPSNQVKNNPQQITNFLETIDKLQLVIVPSGYGLPLKPLKDLDRQDIALLALKNPNEGRILGLTDVLIHLKSAKIPGFVIPGVIHLPTVPRYRKFKQIDMGTPDKVCSVATALKTLSEQRNLLYKDCNFVLIEAGSAFTAVIGIKNGKIVDGIGGTNGCIGFRARGGMDGELCYLYKEFSKDFLYRGGFLDMIEQSIEPSQIDQNFVENPLHSDAWKHLIEGTVKDLTSVALSCNPDYIVLSGSLAENPYFINQLQRSVKTNLDIDFFLLSQFIKVKGAALGAAYLADGVAGGENESLVEILELKKASGSCLEYLCSNEKLNIPF